jgi:hypothetical protein
MPSKKKRATALNKAKEFGWDDRNPVWQQFIPE